MTPTLRAAAWTIGIAFVLGSPVAFTPRDAAAASPSAIGSQAVQWLAVSPAYARSGMVVAMAAPLRGCSSNCVHLWVSHNGGNSWKQSSATGWAGGRPVITVDGAGHDVLVAASGSELQESTDGGGTWSNVAAGGTALPAISPRFASDGAVAAANPQGHDYLHNNNSNEPVTGSGGAYVDLSFMYAPGFPAGGHFSPVLLSAEDSHTQLPVIQQCSASFACSGAATLPGAGTFSAPSTLIPSTDYTNDGTVFAQSGRGIYKSSDGGRTFAVVPLVPSNGAEATATPMLALAPGYREAGPVRTAYAAVFQVFTSQSNPHTAGGVYKTSDGGASWQALGSPSPLDGGVMAVAVAPDGRIFAGYVSTSSGGANAGLLCSQNGGKTWITACSQVGGGAPSSQTGDSASTAPACPTSSCAPSAATPAAANPTPASGSRVNGGALASGGQSGGGPSGAVIGAALGVLAVLAGVGAYLPGYMHRRRARAEPGG